MFNALFGTSKSRTPNRPRRERSPFSSPYTTVTSPVAARRSKPNERRRIAADYDDEDDEGEEEPDERDRLLGHNPEAQDEDEGEEEEDEEEDEDANGGDITPLLPIFSAAHLDSLPVYNLTLSIRLLIVSRVENTLTWDQLRAPQVSQFLLKPIQQQIRDAHFSRATEYALMANCLQFNKEVGMNPGLMGVNQTRAMVCELLAMRLLKDYSTRELIDALAYDFFPLQGQTPPGSAGANAVLRAPRVARISCLEVAIRASAKRFLAHPLVVQQLEAIWAGSIVFHSAADNLHRAPTKTVPNQNQGYGSMSTDVQVVDAPSKLRPAKQRDHLPAVEVAVRRSVTLYDPRDASLFKLSRLRVPRYRNVVSTLSFAVLLGLFLAVLIERSLEITPLEVVFWIWAAGYMLDEIVTFNEQGFGLYIASFWNTFDLGILILLLIHLILRIYGIVMPDVRKHRVAAMAYDVLAADAVLLFPRLFSVLDHYRYFSQLIIAFRIMATDFLAIFIMIIISCSGFFVALTLSFGDDTKDSAGGVAYALLQLLMGFTPAAWERWAGYNVLGKTLLVLFMFITHFLVVTILITVLTNSFMKIVQNANEEHQYLFAVNTISMVKSDSLFSYIAPTNIFQWLLTPLRYFVPFRRFVKINRTVIKVTHFPILFIIYLYERTILRSTIFEPTDLVERGRSSQPRQALFSPLPRRMVREPSIATYQKDRALEEVFRRTLRDTSRNMPVSQERRKTSHVVNNWMNAIPEGEVLSPPQEQDRTILERLEARKKSLRLRRSQMLRNRRDFTDRSVASNPEDYFMNADLLAPPQRNLDEDITPSPLAEVAQQTDHDGDDELLTEDPDEDDKTTTERHEAEPKTNVLSSSVRRVDYFDQQPPSRPKTPHLSESLQSFRKEARFLSPPLDTGRPKSRRQSPTRNTKTRPHHSRNVSTATILYNPVSDPSDESRRSSSGSQQVSPRRPEPPSKIASARNSAGKGSGTKTPVSAGDGKRTPKKAIPNVQARPRPTMPNANNPAFRSVPNFGTLIPQNTRRPMSSGRRHFESMDLGSDIGDNKAIGGGWLATPGGFPASYSTNTWMQSANPALRNNREQERRRRSADDNDNQDSTSDSGDNQAGMFGRLMLARMNHLEAGMKDVVSEMRDHLRKEISETSSQQRSSDRPKLTKAQTTTRGSKGKEKEREPQRPMTARRGKSGYKAPVIRSKGNSEAGPARAENEWVDETEDGTDDRDAAKTTSSA